jgi:hypothetical protein
MDSNFCPSFKVKNPPAHLGFQRLFREQEWELKRVLATTIISLGVGMATGTTLAIALDVPPVLGICQAMHSVRSK